MLIEFASILFFFTIICCCVENFLLSNNFYFSFSLAYGPAPEVKAKLLKYDSSSYQIEDIAPSKVKLGVPTTRVLTEVDFYIKKKKKDFFYNVL